MKSAHVLLSVFGTVVVAEHEKRAGGGKKDKGPTEADLLNDSLGRLSLLVGGCVLAFFLVWHNAIRLSNHIRRLTTLTNDSQRYFTSADPYWAWLKRSVVYAPIFRTRHNREFRLSAAVNVGTLPTRFQTFLLLGVIAMNVVLCCVTIPYASDETTVLGLIRNRSGTMATVNLIPLVVMAGRNNPLIKLLNVPFDTWNLLHRWFARIVVLEALTHVIAWMVNKVNTKGWGAVQAAFKSQFIMTGLIAIISFVVLALHSPSAIRHAFYETFLHFHQLFVATAFATLCVHLKSKPALKYIISAIVLWAAERITRFSLIIYRNFGKKRITTAVVEVLPGEALRITLKLVRPWKFKPGQHLYLYMPSVGFWMSHPFSAAWSETVDDLTEEKGLVKSRQDVLSTQKSTISLIIRRRTGFTNTLFERASATMDGRISLKAVVEGPYGIDHSLDSYGTVLLFAAGVGITHHVSFVRYLIEGYTQGTVSARRVTLVWIIQSPEHLEWIRPWMNTILSMEGRRDMLRIMLFITRPRNTREIHSPSSAVQMFPGKPNIQTLVDAEIENQIGAMGVLVCGTGSLSDDVRRVCRTRQSGIHIDFLEESFSW
ncbi:ferric-chelate reductase, variant [Blastomyces dermatitidis ER-3]|uniref:ferric-chelate reductase (NADPH) n=3 Tax=Blastomyces TaxID=229219 RepID=A0A179UG56_BLAGS|nr:ferric-chelate reductase [Blastomyces gilchristii SLH14081]XP_031577555.1 ferric-chelate reductase, variant [Blastomyces gilchristii SLH14081]XP_045272137.1 ferric-chelate reductase [Blastomyces dermatitidis ER-3]XP_045279339.1 ferric-chelate reductase, variant [Blastomyces dermatitidis ER-3]EGE79907.1 ferric-chelate reductase [Blastomyces dermatitidis ATCC 18188]EEQ84085.1 ferric-chelate reductase [Blastomyces dermatitidis ER-3]KMW67136.1 ferric-chelate reductase, variant [Blastomyces der